MKRALLALLATYPILMTSSVSAESRELTRMKRDGRVIREKTRSIQRDARKLAGAERTKANAALDRLGLGDQDDDGVPDLLEDSYGTDACNPTSDGDHRDGDKREREGRITAATDESITVGGIEFTLTSSTVYEGLEQSALAVGSCVNVEGFINDSGGVTATKIEVYDRCKGGGASSSSRSSSRSSSSSSSSSSEDD